MCEARRSDTTALQLTCDENDAPAFAHRDYTVSWVCALPTDLEAAWATLDEQHPSLPNPDDDNNTYLLGRIHPHNVVVTCLPSGQRGRSSAAVVSARLKRTFPSIHATLLVGIDSALSTRAGLGRGGDKGTNNNTDKTADFCLTTTVVDCVSLAAACLAVLVILRFRHLQELTQSRGEDRSLPKALERPR